MCTAVDAFDGAIQRRMSPTEIGRRHVRGVEVRERSADMAGSGGEHLGGMGREALAWPVSASCAYCAVRSPTS